MNFIEEMLQTIRSVVGEGRHEHVEIPEIDVEQAKSAPKPDRRYGVNLERRMGKRVYFEIPENGLTSPFRITWRELGERAKNAHRESRSE